MRAVAAACTDPSPTGYVCDSQPGRALSEAADGECSSTGDKTGTKEVTVPIP